MASENEQIVNDFCKAWATLNVDRVMEFFSDDAVYHNIPMKPAKGKAEIRKTIAGLLPGTESLEFKILNTAVMGSVVMNERVDSFMIRGKKISIPVAGVFEIAGGKIKAWRDYFDLPTFTNQMKGAK